MFANLLFYLHNVIFFKVEKSLRGHRQIIILETRNDGIRFSCGSLQSLSEEYLQVMGEYNCAQETLVNEVLVIAGKSNIFSLLCNLMFYDLSLPLMQVDMLILFVALETTSHNWMFFAGLWLLCE